MSKIKAYRLNVDTIETIEDVKVIFGGLNLTTHSAVKDFDVLKKYFTEEIVDVDVDEDDDDDEDSQEECDTCS